jgi:hypothetical protein
MLSSKLWARPIRSLDFGVPLVLDPSVNAPSACGYERGSERDMDVRRRSSGEAGGRGTERGEGQSEALSLTALFLSPSA